MQALRSAPSSYRCSWATSARVHFSFFVGRRAVPRRTAARGGWPPAAVQGRAMRRGRGRRIEFAARLQTMRAVAMRTGPVPSVGQAVSGTKAGLNDSDGLCGMLDVLRLAEEPARSLPDIGNEPRCSRPPWRGGGDVCGPGCLLHAAPQRGRQPAYGAGEYEDKNKPAGYTRPWVWTTRMRGKSARSTRWAVEALDGRNGPSALDIEMPFVVASVDDSGRSKTWGWRMEVGATG